MTITVEATYENGVLKPAEPLPLAERTKVRITIDPPISWAQRTYGIIGWTGDSESLQPFALDPELDPQERP